MFDFLKKNREIKIPKAVDEIENAVYDCLKEHGFKKYGRTLHRFVSKDISQVIHFQSGVRGMSGFLCINIGIRIPECFERCFQPQNDKKYYHEYECTMRSRLGEVSGKKGTWYDLSQSTKKTIKSILNEITEVVLPAFDVLNSRESVLIYRRDYPSFDTMSRTILLEECMIYGHLGNMDKAKELFELHYDSVVAEYNDQMKNGCKIYLKKGSSAGYMGQQITAEEDGYVTLYGANHGHIDYLDKLAVSLGLR